MNTDESGPWEPACSGLPQQMVLTLCPYLYFVGGVRLRIVSYLGFCLVHNLHRLHRIVGVTGKPQTNTYCSLVINFNTMSVGFYSHAA